MTTHWSSDRDGQCSVSGGGAHQAGDTSLDWGIADNGRRTCCACWHSWYNVRVQGVAQGLHGGGYEENVPPESSWQNCFRSSCAFRRRSCSDPCCGVGCRNALVISRAGSPGTRGRCDVAWQHTARLHSIHSRPDKWRFSHPCCRCSWGRVIWSRSSGGAALEEEADGDLGESPSGNNLACYSSYTGNVHSGMEIAEIRSSENKRLRREECSGNEENFHGEE